MNEQCAKHQFEPAEDVCRTCGWDFCGECLVYAFGPNKPPFCMSCALAASGVRTGAGNPPLRTKKEIKARAQAVACGPRLGPALGRPRSRSPRSTTSSPPEHAANGEENPLSWLDDHLGGSGERVPF